MSQYIHTQPALESQVSEPAGIRLKIVPLVEVSSIGSPQSEPAMAAVMPSGIRICMVVTPKLPSPAFIPRA